MEKKLNGKEYRSIKCSEEGCNEKILYRIVKPPGTEVAKTEVAKGMKYLTCNKGHTRAYII